MLMPRPLDRIGESYAPPWTSAHLPRLDDSSSACIASSAAISFRRVFTGPIGGSYHLSAAERRRRFYAVAPRMGKVVRRVDAEPRLAALWAARFPFTDGWEG